MRRPKVADQISHAKRRFKARLGLKLTPKLYASMIQDIQGGQAELVDKQSNRVSIFRLEVDGHTVKVVYDKHTKAIVTVLPSTT